MLVSRAVPRLLHFLGRIGELVSLRILHFRLRLYYTKTWAMRSYFWLFPPCKRTWCALLHFRGVMMPAQNIWRRTLEGLDAFEAREDDVFVVTFPKAGTHAILPLLVDLLWSNPRDEKAMREFTNSTAHGHYPMFLEFGHPFFKALDQVQPGNPRIFQTHLPLHLFPKDAIQKGCKIIYLTRDPRACTVSALHFCRNKKRKLYEPSVEELVDSEWNEDLQIFGGWHCHVGQWVRFLETRESSLVLSYEDLAGDPLQAATSLRKYLDITMAEGDLEAVVSRNKIHARRTAASAGDKKYFRRGATTVDEEWHSLIPEASRVRVQRLFNLRWKDLHMDELLDAHPFLRRYLPTPKRAGDIRRVVIAGLGFHCRRIYIPRLQLRRVKLALVVDLDSQRESVEAFLRGHGVEAERYLWVPTSDRCKPTLSGEIAAALAAADADGLIVSSDPLAHEPYLRWALEHNVDVLVDKPPIIPHSFRLCEASAARLASDFEQVLALAEQSESNAMVMSQRRAHPGYRFVHAYLSAFVRQWQVPLSYIDLYHADGMWCMPGEMCTRDYHPYKYGYGKLMFSGYHFVDLLMWLLSINDEERTHPPPSRFSVQCGRFGPRDALAQTDGDRLETLLGACKAQVEASLAQVPDGDLSGLGELDVHAIVQSVSSSGAVECTASLNLLHTSFSRRAWFEPRADLYKGNGRVRHERLVVQVGPLLSLHIHSYQTGRDPSSARKREGGGAGGGEEERGQGQNQRAEQSNTRELLEQLGFAGAESVAGGDGSEYGAGHEEHFDITIYRNTAVVGGPAVETIPMGKMMMAEEGEGGAWLGHNEKARHMLLDDWLRRVEGGGRSPLRKQRETMRMLSQMYEQLARVSTGPK